MAEPVILAHWYQRFDTFQFSTQEFYDHLCGGIGRRVMPQVGLSRVNLPEGGMLSGHRDYLKVRRGKHAFVLCAANFGIDFFVSWWLLEEPGCLSGCLTSFFPFLALFARRTTFYEEDTAAVFRDAVHQCVLDTIDAMFTGRGKEKPVFDRIPKVRSRILA
jgi:hypothetical protein